MMQTNTRSALIGFIMAGLLALTTPAPVHAEMIGTQELLQADVRAGQLAKVQNFLAKEQVRSQLEAWGVDPLLAANRVAALTDSELQQLAMHLDQQPAGGDIFGLVGLVFVVLLILELVGVIDIFKKI